MRLLPKWFLCHPELDSGSHTLFCLSQAEMLKQVQHDIITLIAIWTIRPNHLIFFIL